MTREEAIEFLKTDISRLWNTPQNLEHKEALEMAIKALEQEPCGDMISRQAVIDTCLNIFFNGYKEKDLLHDIKKLPSVNPQEPKTGHWEWVQYDSNPNIGNWHCSECGSIVIECVSKEKKGGIPLYKYCPQCGVKIE